MTTDLTVIGGGPGGYVAAIRAAQAGLDVTLVEEAHLGGVCLNEGCVPSKALIHAAELTSGHGVAAIGSPPGAPDAAAIHDWQQGIVQRMRRGIAGLLEGAGVRVLDGTGRLDGPGRVVVEGNHSEDVATEQIIVATGSAAVGLRDLPFDGERVVSSTDALAPAVDGGRAVVVGGGYIGLELASAYADLGWQVTVIEATNRLLPGLDPSFGKLVQRDLTTRGIDVRVGHIATKDDGSAVHIAGPDGADSLPADRLIVSIGRRPRTGTVGLDTVGITTDNHGLVPVDDKRRSDAAGIFAIGDITAGPALAHKAMQEGTVAAEVAAGLDAAFHPAAIPAVVYTRPELAFVGLTAHEAAERGLDVDTFEVPLGTNARALTLGGERGFARLVVHRGRGLVLGAQLAGPGVGELIGMLTLAIELGAVVEDLAGTILPHPSLSELVAETAHAAVGAPRHVRARAQSTPQQ